MDEYEDERSAWNKIHPPAGARPGTLIIPDDAIPPVIRLIEFNEDSLDERVIENVFELKHCLDSRAVSWIDVHGLGDERILRELAEVFSIHPLALEDVVHIPQRPKTEIYPDQQYFVLRMALLLETDEIDVEQTSIFFGHGYVLTFQERAGDSLEPVRKRIRRGGGPIRRSGTDYLAYAIIDAIVDGYYPVLEKIGDEIDELEERVIEQPDQAILTRINELKRELLDLRRALWPLRDAVGILIRDPSPFVTDEVKTYLRDVYDHCVQLSDVIETYRDLVSGLMNTWLSMISNRTNEIMKEVIGRGMGL